jgi:hypothetical protein
MRAPDGFVVCLETLKVKVRLYHAVLRRGAKLYLLSERFMKSSDIGQAGIVILVGVVWKQGKKDRGLLY